MLLSLLKISGHSMEPVIKNGQTVLASSIPYFFSNPKVGNIIAFKHKTKIFIKRITKIDKEKYFVKGDNKDDSIDSRKFGFIERKEIAGYVFFNF